MLTIEVQFLTGRFHATPWGRNVNEGVPEWPPAPYRLVRAVFDAWKRKRSAWPAARVEPLLAALASFPPEFHLPQARAAHTRSYLSENDRNTLKRQKVLDAFVVVDPSAPVQIQWPEAHLLDEQARDLDELLGLLNFLGRSESWVMARVTSQNADRSGNCVPVKDGEEDIGGKEIVRVACPLPAGEYEVPGKAGRKKGITKPVRLPWLDVIGRSTGELIDSRANIPPGFQFVPYHRPRHCFDQRPEKVFAGPGKEINGVLYAMVSKVPAQVTDTVEIAERVHRKLMGIHKKLVGDPDAVSCRFSGKDAEGCALQGHTHVYILPADLDGDGKLDHLWVVSREPLTTDEVVALDRLESLWQSKRRPDLRLVPVKFDQIHRLFSPGQQFRSATPFVPPRHHHPRRESLGDWLTSEVRREAKNHGLPEIVKVEAMPALPRRGGRELAWYEFRRSRKGDPPRPGYGLVIEFAEPVSGPVALGYGAHFGLGQFNPG